MTTPSSYIFLSDPSQDTVKVFDSNGNFLQNLTPPQPVGSAIGPDGLAIGADKNLYVGTILNHSVLKFNPTNGQYLGTFVTSGEDGLGSATDVKFGPDGNLYVSNFASFAGFEPNSAPIINPSVTDNVLVFSPTGQYLQTLNFPGGGAQLPLGLTFITNPINGDSELLASTRGGTYNNTNGGMTTINGNAIYSFDLTKGATTGTVFASGGQLDGPAGLSVGPNNLLYVSSLDNNKILTYNLNGTFNSAINNNTLPGIDGPITQAFSPDNQEIVTTGFNSANAAIFNSNGTLNNLFIPVGGTPTLGFVKNSGALWVTPADIGGFVVPEPLNILGAATVVVLGIFVKTKLKK